MTTNISINNALPIDHLCAEKLLTTHNEKYHSRAYPFLVRLLQKSREGHLCIQDKKGEMIEALSIFLNQENPPIMRWRNCYYLTKNFSIETSILKNLQRLHNAPPSKRGKNMHFFNQTAPALSPHQKEAVCHALNNTVTLITGGPGSGKTHLAKTLIDICLSIYATVIFTAPTGRATFRFKNQRIIQKTLHHILGLHPFTLDVHPLIADFIIVDECSMIDARLFSLLLSSIASGSHLILIGDPDQLPPIESGPIFHNLLQIQEIRRIHLQHNLRSQQDALISLAQQIQKTPPEQIIQFLANSKHACMQWLPFPPQENIISSSIENKMTILTPFHHGPFGTKAYNNWINKNFPSFARKPIIITKNHHSLKLMNGDIGWKQSFFAYFDHEQTQQISLSQIPYHELAWAISIHKSQGSEFDHVALFLPPGSEIFGRRLLYTGVTRARYSIKLFASQETLHKIIMHEITYLCNLSQRWIQMTSA